MRRLLKRNNIKCENESYVRKSAETLHGDFIHVSSHPFYGPGGICRDYPYGYITDLPRFVDHLLESYEQNDQLTWHCETIPEEEVWIKLGGDHGKKSLKFTLEIANTEKPNSKDNTIVIAKANVKDSFANIVRFVEQGIGEQIFKLADHFWKGKRICIFVNGDYEFFAKYTDFQEHKAHIPVFFVRYRRNSFIRNDNVHMLQEQWKVSSSIISHSLMKQEETRTW